MSCTWDKPHGDCKDITHKIQGLESERDRLKHELSECDRYAKEQYKAYDAEISRLKAEMNRFKTLSGECLDGKGCNHKDLAECITGLNSHLIVDRDAWKAKAERYTTALRLIEENFTDKKKWCRDIAKAALEEVERE